MPPAAWPGPSAIGASASRTGAGKIVVVFSIGSRIGMLLELYSGDPNSGPLALTVG